jgi:hypothetical protein
LVSWIKELKMSEKNNKIPMAKRFFPGLLPIIGDEKYNKVINRYHNLYSKHELPVNKHLRWHLIEGILPGFALYQTLRESGESQESALEIIDQIFEKLFSNNQRRMKKIGSLPFIYPLLRLLIKPVMGKYPAEGWKIDWKQIDKNSIRFDMKSCFYFDTLSKYGAPELTASFCQVDDFVYGNMSPYLSWQRTKTIARGNDYCDFCFARVKK